MGAARFGRKPILREHPKVGLSETCAVTAGWCGTILITPLPITWWYFGTTGDATLRIQIIPQTFGLVETLSRPTRERTLRTRGRAIFASFTPPPQNPRLLAAVTLALASARRTRSRRRAMRSWRLARTAT